MRETCLEYFRYPRSRTQTFSLKHLDVQHPDIFQACLSHRSRCCTLRCLREKVCVCERVRERERKRRGGGERERFKEGTGYIYRENRKMRETYLEY